MRIRAASAAFFFAVSSFAGLLGGATLADRALAAPAVPVGVNLVNPQWLNPADRDAAVMAMARAGVTLVRLPLLPPQGGSDDDTLRFVQRLDRLGMKVVLILYLAYPESAPRRPIVRTLPEMFSEPALSAADPDLFRAKYGPLLARLDRMNVTLGGLELGNEINWAAFNGEFPVPGAGRVLGDMDLRDDPLGRHVAAGLRAYVRSAAALKAIRDRLVANRRTPIISAGLADIRPGEPADAVEIPATLRFLRSKGLDALVDAYGVHTYPPADRPKAERAAYLDRHVFAECGVPPTGRPCWLTEWGYPSASLACPVADDARATRIGETVEYLADLARSGRLAGSVYYQWSGDDDRLGLYRCGRLTPGGVLALRPLNTSQ